MQNESKWTKGAPSRTTGGTHGPYSNTVLAAFADVHAFCSGHQRASTPTSHSISHLSRTYIVPLIQALERFGLDLRFDKSPNMTLEVTGVFKHVIHKLLFGLYLFDRGNNRHWPKHVAQSLAQIDLSF